MDNINSPKHYTSHPSGIECIEIVEHLPFCLGAAVKYIWRAGLKGDEIEDLNKAVWYLRREIQRIAKIDSLKRFYDKEQFSTIHQYNLITKYMNYCKGRALEYIWSAIKSSYISAIMELNNAINELNNEIDRLTGNKKVTPEPYPILLEGQPENEFEEPF